ncbi:MAG: WecB/TagA/CpsF family glycosyltransferase [Phycisphaerae bacterium]|nr:WecB/TagA/CpsF family glycosyltransferase [Phycisphaerae bacterium]MCL4717808.1 WecB/TagA/CpsF family glycosyltransferase [Phycisphaerae bacterium]
MPNPWDNYPEYMILGVPVRAMRMSDVVRAAESVISGAGGAAADRHMHIGVVNAAKVVNMRRDAALREAVLTSDLILADGIAVVWASRALGTPLPERVAGIDLMTRLLELADRRKLRVYLFGATEDVNAKMAEEIARCWPGAVVAGRRNGYYAADEEEAIARQIGDSRSDLLFVAMSPPKKEIFLARWGAVMRVPVSHGVGGAFDVVAGKVKRAPAGWQKLGLEWLYRVVQEPRRMWRRYLTTNTAFAWMLAGAWVRKRFGGGERGSPTSARVSQS